MTQEFSGKAPKQYIVTPIGFVRREEKSVFIDLLPQYTSGLKELENFGHAQIFWWFDKFDDPQSRKTTQFDEMPFEAPPLGIFASRAPMRPNPIGLSTVKIMRVDQNDGWVEISEIDAFDNTPVLDMKGYLPSYDRVKTICVPEWAEDWPVWLPEEGIGLDRKYIRF